MRLRSSRHLSPLSRSAYNPQTKSSGIPTIIGVLHPGGMACHLVRHHIVGGNRVTITA
jgi:hypothetical protein